MTSMTSVRIITTPSRQEPARLLEISRESPSERETMIDARESAGIVGKQERGSLGCLCVRLVLEGFGIDDQLQ